ncbi:MAG: DeoR/GlpR family DNA-binding transcription regulator [Victivallaceae bacterium]|nr:DeoR/GlpR family DNA-binding transcription regulator [Victivallaceae bacterium]
MKDRQQEIRRYIEERKEVSLSELGKQFPDWSEMTLRRDLEALEKSRCLIRTRGGARVLPTSYGVAEDVYGERENRNYAAKQAIALKAANFIEPDSGIFIDAGTTAMALARSMPDSNVAVITSAPNVALELILKKQHPSVILLGGTLSRKTISISGLNVLDQLRDLNIDTAFMSASGYTADSGFSVGNQQECELKKLVVSRARRVVMLIDSTKIGVMLPFTFSREKDIDVLITDQPMPSRLQERFTASGAKVI